MNNSPLGNRKLIRAINRSIILNAIKTNTAIARADLARLTGLSAATVTGITAELIEEGLVFEKETGDSSGGRRPIMLAINPRGGYVIGVKVMEEQAVGALTDLEASVLCKQVIQFESTQPEKIVAALTVLVQELANCLVIPKDKLLGVGVGLAGIIDYEKGLLRQSPFFGWHNINFRQLLQESLSCPVYIDNDVNTFTLAEKWYGSGEGIENFLCITVGRGVGMGIVTNGQFYRGKSGGAGEFGHIVIEPNGLTCHCGKSGCLETFVSEGGLLHAAAKASLQGELAELPRSADELISMADTGDQAARDILKNAGKVLGQAIANLVNIFNPELILISGEGVRYGEYFFAAVKDSIQEYAMPGLQEDLTVSIEPWGDDVWARGAASLVLRELFENPAYRE
jgi:N-acetylglucosamine repressor